MSRFISVFLLAWTIARLVLVCMVNAEAVAHYRFRCIRVRSVRALRWRNLEHRLMVGQKGE
jgi:hypothetical protein